MVPCGGGGHGSGYEGRARGVGARTAAHLERVVVLPAVVHVVVGLAHALEEVARLHGARRPHGGRRRVPGRRRRGLYRRGRGRAAAAAEERVADHRARHRARHRRAERAHHACPHRRSRVKRRSATGAAEAVTRVGGERRRTGSSRSRGGRRRSRSSRASCHSAAQGCVSARAAQGGLSGPRAGCAGRRGVPSAMRSAERGREGCAGRRIMRGKERAGRTVQSRLLPGDKQGKGHSGAQGCAPARAAQGGLSGPHQWLSGDTAGHEGAPGGGGARGGGGGALAGGGAERPRDLPKPIVSCTEKSREARSALRCGCVGSGSWVRRGKVTGETQGDHGALDLSADGVSVSSRFLLRKQALLVALARANMCCQGKIADTTPASGVSNIRSSV